jgi:amino acid adenylation domain-containing protein
VVTQTVLPLIEANAFASPFEVAARDADAAISYESLWIRSATVAHELWQLGARRGSLVGLCVDRSVGLVLGAVGVARAGAAYVAIDPAYPDERIRWMLEDAGVVAVVTDTANASRENALGGWQHVVVEPVAAGLRNVAPAPGDSPVPEQSLPPGPDPEDLAYVVYTSGSTGRPKGVLVDHAALANLTSWHIAEFGLGRYDRCTQVASPGFDAAVWEIWPALAAGAALHVMPDGLATDPVRLRDWLVAESITVSFLPTAVAETIVGLRWPRSAALRYVLTGGDALTRRPDPQLPFTLVNNYGLSETAVVATSGEVSPTGEGTPSIGRPIAGVLAEVVDGRLEPVQPGSPGELLLGGRALARGYLNRDELTAERFVNSPGGRRYRTGDRVRLRPDGAFDFLGRLDDQLSIRGFRVEPGEIATMISSHPGVETAVVVGVGSAGADHRLLVHAVASGAEPPSDEELTGFVSASLPDYMVPSAYRWLDQLPLTAHGKIDQAALRAPVGHPPGVRAEHAEIAGPALPENWMQLKVTALVAELLEVERVGMDENFFLLGGHSMLGAQLIVRLNDLFGVEISLRYLFDHPTPAEIAAEVRRQRSESGTEAEAVAP